MALPPTESTNGPEQSYRMSTGMEIDPRRFATGDAIFFTPLPVRHTIPLSSLLANAKLSPDNQVNVAQVTAATQLAFRAEELAYHHVAQGEMAGEPWMVSF